MRIPSLDGLRGVAAVMVMLFHFNIFFLPQAKVYVGRSYLAVDLFFLLSGFVMAHVYGAALASNWPAHWRLFALARFARIYPLFALTLLATVVVVALYRMEPLFEFSVASLTLHLFLLQQWIAGPSWDYPTWSISAEMEAYVAFVFTAGPLLAGRYPRLMAASCAAVVILLSFYGGGRLNESAGFAALVRTLAEFSLGVLLYRAHKRGVTIKWGGAIALLLFGLGLFTRQDFFVVGGLAYLTYYSVSAMGVFGWLLNSRPAVLLGDWSYGIYLWHAPVHLAVMGVYPVGNLSLTGARLLLFVTAVLVICLSAVTYQYFERPMRGWLTRV